MSTTLIRVRNTVIVAVLASLSIFLGGCGDDTEDKPLAEAEASPVAPEEITITVRDDGVDIPEQLESEPVALTLENQGKETHRAYFARLNEGVSADQVEKSLGESEEAVFSLITLAGNLAEVEPGASSDIVMLFPEGNYLVVDPEVEGPPPLAFFEVVAATGPEVQEPQADYTIETGEFYFEISDPTAGAATVEIANVGEQAHEVGIGRDDEEVTTIFAPPPGGKAWTDLTLEPGDYILECHLPDPDSGKPHLKLGMKAAFTVQ